MKAAYKYNVLENHSDYDISISRSNSDEIRNDPFGLGNNVKGLANLNHELNLSNYAMDLVAHYAKYECDEYKLSLSDLSESDQNELVRLYIESTDREVTECVNGNDFSKDNDYTCALLAMLKDDSKENREAFAEITRKNVIAYYQNSLQELLDNTCNDYLLSSMNEQGYFSRRDLEHGDFLWSKF